MSWNPVFNQTFFMSHTKASSHKNYRPLDGSTKIGGGCMNAHIFSFLASFWWDIFDTAGTVASCTWHQAQKKVWVDWGFGFCESAMVDGDESGCIWFLVHYLNIEYSLAWHAVLRYLNKFYWHSRFSQIFLNDWNIRHPVYIFCEISYAVAKFPSEPETAN